MKKLIVVAHGIGDHQPDFYQEWEAIIRKNTPGNYLVAGLFWDDVLDKVAEKFPLISQNFADATGDSRFSIAVGLSEWDWIKKSLPLFEK